MVCRKVINIYDELERKWNGDEEEECYNGKMELNSLSPKILAASLQLLHCINLALAKTLHEHQVSRLTLCTPIR